MRYSLVALIASVLFVGCQEAPPSSGSMAVYNASDLIIRADSAHHVVCYAISQYRSGALSCLALDSAHWSSPSSWSTP